MNLKETHKYDDIIQLSRPAFQRRAGMSNYDRAAQFSPFAALTGFEAAIEETGRRTDSRIELDEGGRQLLDRQMQDVLEAISRHPKVELLWFCYDERKSGGSYRRAVGQVKKIDPCTGKLLFTDGRMIPLGEIFSIEIVE